MKIATLAPETAPSKARRRNFRVTILLAAVLPLLVARASLAGSPPGPASSWRHARPIGSSAIGLLAIATERSSIIVALLKELEKTDIVVYLADTMPWAVSGPASYLVFLSSDPNARYLLVRIDRFRLTPPERIASLGHELQHALEVAAAPEVRDVAGLAALYRKIGWESERDRFETEGARNTANRVRRQLARADP